MSMLSIISTGHGSMGAECECLTKIPGLQMEGLVEDVVGIGVVAIAVIVTEGNLVIGVVVIGVVVIGVDGIEVIGVEWIDTNGTDRARGPDRGPIQGTGKGAIHGDATLVVIEGLTAASTVEMTAVLTEGITEGLIDGMKDVERVPGRWTEGMEIWISIEEMVGDFVEDGVVAEEGGIEDTLGIGKVEERRIEILAAAETK